MYLVFDIGGTNMRVAVSADGKTLAGSQIVPTPKNFSQGIQTLKQIADKLSDNEQITNIAGGVAGPLDRNKSMLVRSPHLGGWMQKPLKEELENLFGCPVTLENDTVMGGIGEATKGAGTGEGIVAYLAIGTGVGGARIVDGKLDRNALGFEPGHQIIKADGNQCACGGKGHLEAYVGGLYIEKMNHLKGEEINDPQIWDQVARNLAYGLTNIAVLWSPDMIILGGSVTQSIPLLKVQKYFGQFLTIFPQAPQVVKATLGDDAGLYGALTFLK